MIHLGKSLQAWGTPDFQAVLKQEVAQLGVDQLPLHQALANSNHVADEPITVLIHGVSECAGVIRVRAGIFYTGVLGGCSCADDPTPPGENNEYCEVQLDIDKASATTTVLLLTD